jgi:4-hydroxybenzoate polyprenyltransferase
MLLTIALIMLMLWIIGLITSIGGALIHVLLVIALILIIVHLLQNRRKKE